MGSASKSGPTPSLTPTWRTKARRHREQQFSRIPSEWRLPKDRIPSPSDFPDAISLLDSSSSPIFSEVSQIFTPFDREVTSISITASAILARIASGEWTSVAVTTAFCKRAALLHQLTGCLTEILFSSALSRAAELDSFFSSSSRVVGPLHGLPLSVKDNHDIATVDTTVGWVGLIDRPARQDHPGIAAYRSLGAVLYVKTNVPQSMMMSDSYNHVWGQSVNAFNRELISGGSSGGEAALISGGGSVLGMGTDIGGSVRIPACLQGLYGLCPTIGRCANRESIRRDKYLVPPVAGPLTRDIHTMETFLQSYLGSRPWEDDPGILPLPWKADLVQEIVDRGVNKTAGKGEGEEENRKKKKGLRIGYIIDDGSVLPQPPIQRAMRETIARLRSAGHEVLEWDARRRKHAYAYELWLKAVLADGGKRCRDLCRLVDEPLIEGMLVGQPSDELNVEQRTELSDQIWDYQREYMQSWKEAEIDALIMPVMQWVGMRPKMWVKSEVYVGYTSIWNLLNWTALTVPITKATKEVDEQAGEEGEGWKKHEARSRSDQINHDAYAAELDLFENMPVGLQIVSGRFGEEKAVGIAKVLASLTS